MDFQLIVGLVLWTLVKTVWSTPTIIETPATNQTVMAGSNFDITWLLGTDSGNMTFNLWRTSYYPSGNSTTGMIDLGVIVADAPLAAKTFTWAVPSSASIVPSDKFYCLGAWSEEAPTLDDVGSCATGWFYITGGVYDGSKPSTVGDVIASSLESGLMTTATASVTSAGSLTSSSKASPTPIGNVIIGVSPGAYETAGTPTTLRTSSSAYPTLSSKSFSVVASSSLVKKSPSTAVLAGAIVGSILLTTGIVCIAVIYIRWYRRRRQRCQEHKNRRAQHTKCALARKKNINARLETTQNRHEVLGESRRFELWTDANRAELDAGEVSMKFNRKMFELDAGSVKLRDKETGELRSM